MISKIFARFNKNINKNEIESKIRSNKIIKPVMNKTRCADSNGNADNLVSNERKGAEIHSEGKKCEKV